MQPEFIAKLIALVQKNRDRVVVTDSATGKAVVILDFAEYERLTSMSETPLQEPPKKESLQPRIRPTSPPEPAPFVDLTQEQFLDKLNRDIGAWKTAQEQKRSAETTLHGVKNSAKNRASPPVSSLEEEERFYLEPLE